MAKKRVFSGIQPTGNLHLGNYLGAILNWVRYQDEKENIFCIVDLHAITVPQDPKELQKNILETAKIYLAAGIDPNKSNIFIQSTRPEHAELAWILNNFIYIGELSKMTQFKEKTGKKKIKLKLEEILNFERTYTAKYILKRIRELNNVPDYSDGWFEKIMLEDQYKQNVNDVSNKVDKFFEIKSLIGLLDYPVLMAADILLYNTDEVPVGEDQKQHVEICRDIAERINKRYNQKVFVVPEPVIQKESARIMSLTNPEEKMSKSDENENSRINILDTPDIIRKKFARATTDSGTEIKFDPDKKPGISNLLNILSVIKQKSITELEKEYKGKSYSEFKSDVAEAVIQALKPLQDKVKDLDDKYVIDVLKNGAVKATPTAQETLKRVKMTIGLGLN
jgi:tryptophanyl-tRNA synthetase